ncbi:MAG: hypothetical protein ACYC4A_10280 [Desulfobulbia bacterium]
MKKVFAIAAIGLCLVGCSSNEEQQEKKGQPRREKDSGVYQQQQPQKTKKVVGLHDKELAEKGIFRDQNGNFGKGSIRKVFGED